MPFIKSKTETFQAYQYHGDQTKFYQIVQIQAEYIKILLR